MGPITNVEVTDYQSIGSASLDLGKLTVIVGRGNLGKSAFMRAIGACLFNETGTGCIRQGTKKTSVTLRFPDDQSVTWSKDDKTARYDVDVAGTPVTFTKLAGGVPDELQDMFGIRTIEIDKTFSMRPQIHGQFDSPLLLAESSGKAARALAKLTKLEVVVAAQMAAARDLRREKQNATARQREVDELTARIGEFPDMDRLDARIGRARTAADEADQRLNVLGDAEEAYHLMLDARRRLEIEPPSIEDLSGILARLDHMQNSVLAHKVLGQAKEGVDVTHRALVAKNLELQSAEADLENFLETLGTCPICGKPMEKDHNDPP